MMQIPRAPLYLGLTGILPFLWGVATYLNDPLANWTVSTLGPRFIGPYVGLAYGTVVLSFMSGALLGFATRANGAQAATVYILSAIPALWAFLMVGGGPVAAGSNLIFGFVGVLVLDYAFQSWGLTPKWWLRFRVMFTAIVVACLSIGVFW